MMKRLSVVIPAYNEAKKIRTTFSRLDRFFSQKPYQMEYVFVNDGSADNTLDIIREMTRGRNDVLILANEKNMGKGYTLRRGMLSAGGDYILFMDADMATPLGAFNDFEEHLGDYDIIIGSRWLKESNIKIPQPWYRRSMGIVFYMIIRAWFLKSVTDTNCGFKCYRRDVAKDIFSTQVLEGWGFDVELLYIAQKRKYRIKEVPVIWAHGRGSKVNLFSVPFLTLRELMTIKINDWKKRYEK
ncbi:MAG: glycosyltransferase family 2 protein [Candidatus Omnitrophica bacterium]|nr:glycosyltransferase family 2 protein [Candidatus Omnitrophota bacterium]